MHKQMVDTNRPLSKDSCERIFLLAARMGHTFVLAEILSRSNININIRSKYGQTALSLAAERGYAEIVTLLLAREDIDVNAQDSDEQTRQHGRFQLEAALHDPSPGEGVRHVPSWEHTLQDDGRSQM